ncbi:MAG: energy transducer TonB [Vicinamibacteria bacterium]
MGEAPAATTIPVAPAEVVAVAPPASEPVEPRPTPQSTPIPTPSPSPAHTGDLVQLSDPGVRPPRATGGISASPTPILERVGVTGSVDLRVLVAETGGVLQTEVGRMDCKPRGAQYERLLREAALKNAAQWHFEPATKGGVAVRVWIPIQVRF